jgi:tRNA (guanine37-N1)-methyltransferase
MRIDILTLHPQMCEGPIGESMLGRARERGIIDIGVHDIREHGHGRHRIVDDAPYGGGSGMVMRVDVVDAAIEAVRSASAHVVLMDPAGTPFDQKAAKRLAQMEHLIFVCGHYEGVDARVREHIADETLSIGDFVLTGGELPALVCVDAVARLIPDVLGNPDSLLEESFEEGRLSAPSYTRPANYQDWQVPEVLLSGHHEKIQQWRRQEAARLTRLIRPDLDSSMSEAADSAPVPESKPAS